VARRTPAAVVWAARVLLVLAGCVLVWRRPGPWLPFATLLLGVAMAYVAGWRGRALRLVALAFAVFVSASSYLSWRLSVLSWSWPGLLVGVPLFLAELHAAVHTLGLHVTVWPRAAARLDGRLDPSRLPVFVFVPTVDEGPEVLEPTLRGVLAARERYLRRHPRARVTVVVCNDGGIAGAPCSGEVVDLAGRLGVECVTRSRPGGAKAGNVEHARQLVGATGDALVVIFDADQVPHEDFLVRTVPPLADPDVGWVQTGQYYRNRDNPVARWADDQQSLFYRLLCPGKAVHDAAFICGTNVVLRAAALDEIGGLPADSVTEDFAASIRLAPRWRSVYLPDVLAVGLGPADLHSYLRQQERWARGTLGVLRRHWRDLLLPRRDGLRAQQRLQYGLAASHYLCGPRDLVFLAAPVLFVTTGINGVEGATLGAFLAHFVPYYAVAVLAFWHAAWRTTSWRGVVLGFGSFLVLSGAAWRAACGRRGLFTVTPKKRVGGRGGRAGRPYRLGLAACAVSLGLALTVRRDPAYWLAACWLGYLCLLLLAQLSLVRQDEQAAGAQVAPQRPARPEQAVSVRDPRRPTRRRGRTVVDRTPRRRAVAAAATVTVAVAGLVGARAAGAGPDPVAAAPAGVPARLHVGLSAADPGAVVATGRALHQRLGLEGRTAELDDRFDRRWADRVAGDGAVPWLTLVASHRGRPGLDSSLTAIANGVGDEALRRWATDIAGFGRPLYLTVLPHVDRNYPASSAVARGGIPQDVGPAWQRMRRVFEQAGARNVAWVWTPADPAADQPYRPPAASIDAVALTLHQYPGTRWVDPATVLAGAAARHPGKPLLVDASLAGNPPARARWLDRLGAAVAARTDVAGLVYRLTGPLSDAGSSQARAWSPMSDHVTAVALGRLFERLRSGGGR
jgi:cellulose synthase/poly-beta-1,6-N-acetylglucosamine synthase-like glycosyltransferase